jgi:LEA14-like dessication related protein
MNRVVVVAIALLAVLTGCATLEKVLRVLAEEELFENPTIQIVGLRVKDVSLGRVETTADVEITNPNPYGVKVLGIDWTLDLEEKRFADGKSEGVVELAPEGKSTATFDVGIPLADFGVKLLDLLQKKEADYVVDALFHVGLDEVKVAIPGQVKGKVPLPKPPVVVVKDVTVKDAGLAGVTFRVKTNVKNPNVFDMLIDKLKVTVALNGRTVLSNREIAGVNIKPDHASDVPFDFTVGLTELGLTLADLALEPTLSWDVDVNLESAGAKLPFAHKGSVKLARAADQDGAPALASSTRMTSSVAGEYPVAREITTWDAMNDRQKTATAIHGR